MANDKAGVAKTATTGDTPTTPRRGTVVPRLNKEYTADRLRKERDASADSSTKGTQTGGTPSRTAGGPGTDV